jgi:hypothetical protein
MRFDSLYGNQRTTQISTRGEGKLFCAILYFITRTLIKDCFDLMKNDKKVTLLPRFLIMAAMANGIIPAQIA